MNINKAQNVITAFISFFIMAGFMTQLGVISGPMAEFFNTQITSATTRFSFLTGGVLIGTFISLFIFDYVPIRRIYLLFYALLSASVGAIMVTNSMGILPVPLAIIGMSCGVGLSAGCVIISQVVPVKFRASAFVATDVFFSLAGAIIPAAAAGMIASGADWYIGFVLVAAVALAMMVLALFTRYPNTVKAKGEQVQSGRSTEYSPWNYRIFTVGAALCLYLIGQNTFLTWAPNYLQTTFNLTALEAGSVVSNYWGPSVIGLIVSSVLLSKIPSRLFLMFVTLCAIAITISFTQIQTPGLFLKAAYAFGFLTSCMYKTLFSVATEQVENPAPRMITFLLCCGTIGSSLFPMLSSAVVSVGSSYAGIWMAAISYLVCGLLIISTLFAEKKTTQTTAATSTAA